eukprot:3508798-Prymnesium_polylepis.1
MWWWRAGMEAAVEARNSSAPRVTSARSCAAYEEAQERLYDGQHQVCYSVGARGSFRTRQGQFYRDKCHVPPYADLAFAIATKHEGSFYTMRDVRQSALEKLHNRHPKKLPSARIHNSVVASPRLTRLVLSAAGARSHRCHLRSGRPPGAHGSPAAGVRPRSVRQGEGLRDQTRPVQLGLAPRGVYAADVGVEFRCPACAVGGGEDAGRDPRKEEFARLGHQLLVVLRLHGAAAPQRVGG